jgi:hypothetical protein
MDGGTEHSYIIRENAIENRHKAFDKFAISFGKSRASIVENQSFRLGFMVAPIKPRKNLPRWKNIAGGGRGAEIHFLLPHRTTVPLCACRGK